MRAPRTLWMFLPQGVVLLLQLIPHTGIILMMLMAAIWPVVLINGPMLACAVEAAFRKGMRRWLLLPGLWFGGYALFVAGSEFTAFLGDRRAEAANARVHVAFDPARQSLLIEGGRNLGSRTAWLLANTDLPVVYMRDPESGAVQAFTGRAAGRACLAPGQDHPCVPPPSQPPGRPVIVVRFEDPSKTRSRGVMTIVSPDGRRQTLHGRDETLPLPWFPLPYAGCGLGSSWECWFRFMPASRMMLNMQAQQPRGLLEKQDEDLAVGNRAVANALGLERVTQARR